MRKSILSLQNRRNTEKWQQFKGEFFPVKKRFTDTRIAPRAAESFTEMQHSKEELRSDFTTGKLRQTVVPLNATHVRPTHFFSLRIPSNAHFMTQIHTVHADIIDFHAEYEQLLIPKQKLHVTTSVLSMEGDESISKVVEATAALVAEEKVAPFRLVSRGMGQFGERVVFCRITPEKDFGRLDAFVRKLRQTITSPSLKSANVNLKGNPNDSYVPHVTVAKIRPHHREQFGNTLPKNLWTPYHYEDFGEFVAPTLDLCEMKTDETTGGYTVVKSIPLSF